MKKILAVILLVATAALFGCGGDAETGTGRFIDAPVQGLAYESGSHKGVTDADGSFIYEIGKTIRFTIGGIVLGEAPAKAIMTPIDLSATANADSTTPDVVARVQLLMSLSSTDPSNGVITIPAATHDAAKNVTINFETDDVATKIADLPKPWKQGVVSEVEAEKHFAASFENPTVLTGSAKKQNDTCKGSNECSGSLICRNAGSQGKRCVGRGARGDDCSKSDAGHGSKSCGGDLKCRSTGDDAYRCVGGGVQGDFCAEADADHGSESCVGSLLCRSTGNEVYRCVGRGEQNDLCAKADAGHGSNSCGGSLTCRDTGSSTWHCIGRGKEGDFCSEEESGHGSWDCSGSLVCGRHSGSDHYSCMDSVSWMSKIADNTPITQLAIPGTHDTATFKFPTSLVFVKTQDMDIKGQLDAGIRFLDIRAAVYPNAVKSRWDLGMFHGDVSLGIYFKSVLDDCIKFLNEHPKETIFISVKKDSEGGIISLLDIPKPDFQEVFLDLYYNSDDYKSFWYDGTTGECDANSPRSPMATSKSFPKMCDVRKKIVLLSRSGLDDKLGIDFHISGNTKSDCRDIIRNRDTCSKGNLELAYEDLYEPDTNDDKVDAVKTHLSDAQQYLKTKKDKLWVTFTSANKPFSLKGPEYYALSGGLPWIDPWLNINGKLKGSMSLESKPMGIVAMDFPSWALIRFLIDTNL